MRKIGHAIGIALVAGMVIAHLPANRPAPVRVFIAPTWPPPPEQAYATLYVSPSGSDSNPGTEGAPFHTIERARTAVRSINAAMAGDIVVYLREGLHTLTKTVSFDEQDSGMNGFQVFYAAYPGEKPVLSGGRAITGWTSAGNGLYRAPVGEMRFRQLYVSGRRAARARTPDAGAYFQIRGWDVAGRRVEVSRDEIGEWRRQDRVEMVILGKGVNQSNLRISSIAAAGTSALITPLEPERTRLFQQEYPPKEPLRPYYLENALEFLDAPGEWYLNTEINEVFYKPGAGEDMSVADVFAPRLERLFGVTGSLSNPVHSLQFHGLTFEHATWLTPNSEGYVGDQASIVFTERLPVDEIRSYPGHRMPAGVHVEAASGIRFERNVFRHMGGSALNLYRAVSDSAVIGNVIVDVAGSGISVDLNLQGNPGDVRIICRRNVVSNNYIARTGRDYFQTVGIMLGYTDGAVVEHNELSDMPYSGITVGWGWDNVDSALRDNVVRHNRVQGALNRMSDGGGIYTLSKQPGTLISENYVHDIVRTGVQGGFNISGIYLDEGSNLITVRDNVLANTGDRAIFQNANGPGNTLIRNEGTSPTVIANAGLEPAFQDIRPTEAESPSSGRTLRLAFGFDEAAGTSSHDASGAGLTATLLNGATWGAGRFGTAVMLDGTNDYATVSSPGLPAGDLTYEAWVYLDRTSRFQTIMEALDGAGGAELEIDVASGGHLEIWSNNTQRFTTTTTIPIGVWTHVALTRSGAVLQAYINGARVEPSGIDSSVLNFGTCPLLIGVDADAACAGALNGYLDGRVDDVRIYSRPLTQTEILADMSTPVG